MGKKHDVFISFATKDRDRAEKLANTLERCGLKVYCSCREAYGQDFPDAIKLAIKNSRVFLAFYTPAYGESRYGDYERGQAVALGLPICAARTSDVLPGAVELLPGAGGLFTHNICTPEGAEGLLRSVFSHLDARMAARFAFEGSPTQALIEELVHDVSRRTAFIAGSVPMDTRDLAEMRMTDQMADLDHAPPERKLAGVVEDIVRGLLRADFVVGSWPVVPGVGNQAFRSAHQFARDEQRDDPLHRIGGIWPGYAQQKEELRLAGINLSKAEDKDYFTVFANFRREYLREYDWLVILGGQSGTREEYDVAKDVSGLRIVTVPALGGTGRSVWEDNPSGPFTPGARFWNGKSRQSIVNYMRAPLKSFSDRKPRASIARI